MNGWLVAASSGEVAAVLARMAITSKHRLGRLKYYEGLYEGMQLRVIVTGMGQERAQGLAQLLQMAPRPLWACIIGISGALRNESEIAEVYLVEWVTQPQSNNKLLATEELLSLPRRQMNIPVVGQLSTKTIVTTAAEKMALTSNSAAHAVDLETYTYATLLQEYSIPWFALRAISDTAQEDLPQGLQRFIDTQDNFIKQFWAVVMLLQYDGLKPLLNLRRRLVRSASSLEAHLRDLIKVFLLDKKRANH